MASDPTNTTVLRVDRMGVVELAAGTRWRVAPGDRSRARKWRTGANVIVEAERPGNLWPWTLTNLETGESIAALALPDDAEG